MKRLFALLLALSMLFALTACGGDDNTTPTSESTGATTNTTESTNDPTDGTQDSTQGTTESTTGGETTESTEPPTTTPPTTEPPTTTPPTTQPSHTHNYTSTITKAPTCTQKGVKTFTCSGCGKSYTEDIKANGHAWGEWTTHTEATATTQGESRRTCKNCTEYETKAIPPKGLKADAADKSVSETGTAFEVAVRQYTHDYNHTSVDSESGRYVFSVSSSTGNSVNILSLGGLTGEIRTYPVPNKYAVLKHATFDGSSPYVDTTGKEAITKTVSDTRTALNCNVTSILVRFFNEKNGEAQFRASTLEQVPDSIFQDVANNNGSIQITYSVPGAPYCTMTIKGTGNGSFSVFFQLIFNDE